MEVDQPEGAAVAQAPCQFDRSLGCAARQKDHCAGPSDKDENGTSRKWRSARTSSTCARSVLDSGPLRADRASVTASNTSAKKTATVLVVDDTRIGRMLVDTVLKGAGHQVIEAQSGLEALEMLEQIRPDLIILDVRMPGMDGFELCEKIKARPDLGRIPVIFLSAACSLEERVKGLSVGGDDFIRKPFEGADLMARVKVHLHRAAMLRPPSPPPPA